MSEKKVRDVMSRGIITGSFDAALSNIAEIMADEGISSLAIVDQNGGVVGIVSSLDVVKAFGEKTPAEISETKAEDIMTSLVYNVNPEMTLKEASNIMVVKGIHRVVVLSEEGGRKPVGLLSATDIVKEVRELKG